MVALFLIATPSGAYVFDAQKLSSSLSYEDSGGGLRCLTFHLEPFRWKKCVSGSQRAFFLLEILSMKPVHFKHG